MDLARLLRKLVESFGFTSDVRELLLFLGIPGGLAMLVTYLGWSTEKTHVLIIYGASAFCLAAISTYYVIQVWDAVAIFKRLTVNNVNIAFVGKEKDGAADVAVTLRLQLRNTSNAAVCYKLNRVAVVIDGKAPKGSTTDANIIAMTPRSSQDVICATVTDVPTNAQLGGTLSLDLAYGAQEDRLPHRFEYECDILVAFYELKEGKYSVVLTTSNIRSRHK